MIKILSSHKSASFNIAILHSIPARLQSSSVTRSRPGSRSQDRIRRARYSLGERTGGRALDAGLTLWGEERKETGLGTKCPSLQGTSKRGSAWSVGESSSQHPLRRVPCLTQMSLRGYPTDVIPGWGCPSAAYSSGGDVDHPFFVAAGAHSLQCTNLPLLESVHSSPLFLKGKLKEVGGITMGPLSVIG